ncbi:uncharacterized protein [Palaemon carinicauda]|uniref:uncharacterized protein n=1 Tax=Palaemon carinicauda TaxID=392227 RepID=UPI0035B603AA
MRTHHLRSGYKVHTTYQSLTTRGLTTLVKSSIPSKIAPSIDCGTEAETLSVQISLLATTLTVHNIYKSPAKSINAEALFAAASKDGSIITGDFNAHHPFLNSISATNQTGRHLHALLQEYPDVTLLNNVTEATHLKGGRLDLTFLSSAIQRDAKWQLHPVLTSMHLAIEVKLELEKYPPPPPPAKRWSPEFANWEKFETAMTVWALEYIKNPHIDISTLSLDFNKQLDAAASVSMPQKKHSERKHADAWYYNSCIKEMNTRINRTRKLFRRYRTDELHDLAVEIIKHSVQVSLEVKTDKWYSWCHEANFSTSLANIWGWFNKVSGKYSTPRVTHPDPLAEANRIGNNFADRAKSTNLPLQTINRQRTLLPIRNNIIETACNMRDDTDSPYTMEQLNTALAKGRKDTAPGADFITYSMLRSMGSHAKLVYLHLITGHIERLCPTTWNQQDTKPLPKPKEPDTYRRIALISCTEKVAERMVLNRLQWKIGQLHHHLYAYRSGIDT